MPCALYSRKQIELTNNGYFQGFAVYLVVLIYFWRPLEKIFAVNRMKKLWKACKKRTKKLKTILMPFSGPHGSSDDDEDSKVSRSASSSFSLNIPSANEVRFEEGEEKYDYDPSISGSFSINMSQVERIDREPLGILVPPPIAKK